MTSLLLNLRHHFPAKFTFLELNTNGCQITVTAVSLRPYEKFTLAADVNRSLLLRHSQLSSFPLIWIHSFTRLEASVVGVQPLVLLPKRIGTFSFDCFLLYSATPKHLKMHSTLLPWTSLTSLCSVYLKPKWHPVLEFQLPNKSVHDFQIQPPWGPRTWVRMKEESSSKFGPVSKSLFLNLQSLDVHSEEQNGQRNENSYLWDLLIEFMGFLCPSWQTLHILSHIISKDFWTCGSWYIINKPHSWYQFSVLSTRLRDALQTWRKWLFFNKVPFFYLPFMSPFSLGQQDRGFLERVTFPNRRSLKNKGLNSRVEKATSELEKKADLLPWRGLIPRSIESHSSSCDF